jgi:sugar phosphate isomerase/epimerase
MEYTHNFYEGGSYSPVPDSYTTPNSPQIPAEQIGLATDARTANQIQEVQKKLRTGAKTIEVSPSIDPTTFDSIPKEQFKEINRLKKLAGIDLTLHGPMIEPSGFNSQSGSWNESQRLQAENQLLQSVERGHALDPDGNLVITFHTAYGIPDTNPTMKTEKDGKTIEEPTAIGYIDEETGQSGFLSEKEQLLLGKKLSPEDLIKDINNRNWTNRLGVINNELFRSRQILERTRQDIGDNELHGLKLFKENKAEYENFINDISRKNLNAGKATNQIVENLSDAEIDVRDAYNRLNEEFNTAYKAAEKENRKKDLEKLDNYKIEVKNSIEKNKDDPLMFQKFSEQVSKGVRVLSDIEAPQSFTPLREFAIDKGAETYANVAYKAYKKYKDKAPIISIENPPAGTAALSTGEDLKDMVISIRNKFVDNAIKDGVSKSEAQKQAEKLIGATWDVGHINMIRKYGYTKKDIINETKKIAPYVKHVHLSDNFGMQHTELPMGMGNVPLKPMLDAISKYNKKIKKISETGGAWYQFFQKEPLLEQFKALGSPVFAAQSSPSWQETGMMAGYFGGLGNFLPEHHTSIYGARFSPTSPDLGGQEGAQNNRFSGSPVE